MELTSEVNVPITVVMQGPSSGLPIAADLVVIMNGAINSSLTMTFADLGVHGLYTYTFTPILTGTYILYAYGAIQAQVNIVTQTLFSAVQNLQDEALGSWQWNKVANTLVMLKQDGTTLATYTVIDNLTESSRERTS
jgi:hypothetical protein